MNTWQREEHDEQAALFQWAALAAHAYPELELLHAIPNGAKLPWMKNDRGKRFSREAIRLKEEGMKPGVPDMHLPVARGGYLSLYIEMKREGGKASEEQKQWIKMLTEQGNLAMVCVGFDDAKDKLEWYLNQPRTSIGLTT